MSSWFSRIHREYEAHNLTLHWREVLLALGRFQGCRFGIFPSHATLATRARCSVRTVQRALQAGRALGLLDWSPRRTKAAWRSLRASNRYVLRLPEVAVRTVGLKARVVTYRVEKEAREGSRSTLAAMLAGAERLPDLLAARRAAWEGGLLGNKAPTAMAW